VDGLIAVGDRPVVLAARAAAALGIRWHTVAGAEASTDKRQSRAAMAIAGLPSPRFTVLHMTAAARSGVASSQPFGFPVVLKPVGLSGSRGVIRADDAAAVTAAVVRIGALLARPEVRAARSGLEDEILVEQYIDGREFALEGVLTDGALRVFALFDKPDRLDGPFFEETVYVTPSRAPGDVQARIVARVQAAAGALRLTHGPLHAECRVTPAGEVFILELAARPIGGLCSRVLSFDRGAGSAAAGGAPPPERASLETVLLEHALGGAIDGYVRERAAAAEMMIPIPRRGIFKGAGRVDAARAVPGITDIRISAKEGQLLEPLPEAGSYLGFIFARGETPADAERSVREAHATLEFTIARELAVAVDGDR
jgi:hypothetical protein